MEISKILSKKYTGAVWSIANDDYSTLTWESDIPKPTLAEIQAHISSSEQEEAAELAAKEAAKEATEAARQAVLAKLGITEVEAQLIAGIIQN